MFLKLVFVLIDFVLEGFLVFVLGRDNAAAKWRINFNDLLEILQV